ncbi:HPP family protein [Mangrovibrevibacter kandeliae]|uniref:HPP family protein n=1 Tax=Mangrovibrevibacter kandeliae TaxID=2968473 RepID=UPI0021179D16|nr:HPP family protein [Aurantimonas sp. CSK15Z-1]MCQ8780888.1 HPP family protein [Aurantimonas sp. CSK15Z-1]
MLRHIRHFIIRHEPEAIDLAVSLKAGVGGLLGIGSAGGLAAATGMPFLLAPFGASAVLLFAQPQSPLAQPANTIGGYCVGLAAGLAVALVFPPVWWAAAIGVGAAIALMSLLRLTHPPAGAVPIVAVTTAMPPTTLVEAVLAGGVLLVAVAAIHHRIPPRQIYPKRAN